MRFRLQRVVDWNYPLAAAIHEMDSVCIPGCQSSLSGSGVWWLVWQGKRVAGYACIRPSHTEKRAGYMSRAGVLPRYRGHGLQCRLIQARVDYARRRGWRTVVTDTTYYNTASANNLIKCGFRLYVPEKRWSFKTALYWKKDL